MVRLLNIVGQINDDPVIFRLMRLFYDYQARDNLKPYLSILNRKF